MGGSRVYKVFMKIEMEDMYDVSLMYLEYFVPISPVICIPWDEKAERLN